jgi:competence protein ComEC
VADVHRIDGPDGAVWHRLNIPHAGASPGLADDRCAVWRLDWRGWRILFTSDAGYRTERQLIDARADVRADIIVAGKHRDDFSLSDDFLTAVNPQVIIAKNPDYPVEERHPPETIEDWRKRGIVFVDQTETGGVTLSVQNNGDLVVQGFLVPQKNFVLSKKIH